MGGHCEYDCHESDKCADELVAYKRLLAQLSNKMIGDLLSQTDKSPQMFRQYESVAVRAEAVKRLTKG